MASAAPADKPWARPHFEIHSARLTIRTPVESDAEAYHALLTNPDHHPYGSGPESELTLDDVKARIGLFAQMAADGKNAFMVIVLRETGALIGHGGYNTFAYVDEDTWLGRRPAAEAAAGADPPPPQELTDLGLGQPPKKLTDLGLGQPPQELTDLGLGPPPQKLMTDLGLVFDHRYWRKGFGREAMDRLVEYARDDLAVQLFRTETDLDNEPWQALLRGLGLGALQQETGASYDANVKCFAWKFDLDQWADALAQRKVKA